MNEISDLDNYFEEIDIHDLIQGLRSPSVNARRKAHKELIRIGDKAIQDLIVLMHEGNRHMLREAVQILGEMTSPKSPRSLAVSLLDDDPLVRWDATKGLANLERGGIVALLEVLVKNCSSTRVRDGARDILRMLDQNKHLNGTEERVLTFLEGPYPDHEVAQAAQAALEVLKENNYPVSDGDVLPATQ